MKTIKQIKDEIKRIEEDDRYKAAPASIQINAPLALIQTDMESRVKTLNWVMNQKKS